MVKKWFHPSKTDTGWDKDDPPTTRRRRALKAHKTYLSTARSLQALANVTRDRKTSQVAQADANYFYKMHEKYDK
jgi:hypothetical protein